MVANDPVLDFTLRLAQESGNFIENEFFRKNIITRLKDDQSVVTEANIASDQKITSAIQANFPGEQILSEELHPAFAPHLSSQTCWVVDPLDGTTNFSLGLPLWGITIVRLVNGSPALAVHYFPILQELYYAQIGKGAYFNAIPIHVESHPSLKKMTVFSCCSRTHQKYRVSIPYKTRIFGSATYSLCNVARGPAIVAFEATAKIWDFAGGWLMVNEAGGEIKTLDGEAPFPLISGRDYAHHNFPVLAAISSKIIVKSSLQLIKKTILQN